jgi:hypothetical protein
MAQSAAFSFSALWQQACAALCLASCLAASAGVPATPTDAGRVPMPVIEAARGGQCVGDPAFMRRNHMVLLKHQRGDTLRGGIRTGKYSLKECIACHASQTTNSVNASDTNFCQSCHNYAAVSLDCFGCHASQPAHSPSPGHDNPSQALLTPTQVKP